MSALVGQQRQRSLAEQQRKRLLAEQQRKRSLDPLLMDADVIALGKATVAKIARRRKTGDGVASDLVDFWRLAYAEFSRASRHYSSNVDWCADAYRKLHLAQHSLFGSISSGGDETSVDEPDAAAAPVALPLLAPPSTETVAPPSTETIAAGFWIGDLATAEQIAASGAIERDAVEVFARGDRVGNGVRATRAIEKGTRVASYGGVPLPLDEPSQSQYLMYLDRRTKIDGDPRWRESHGHLGPLMNDARGPVRLGVNNARFSRGFVRVGGQRLRTIWVVTTRSIAPQEEIFVAYGAAFWQTTAAVHVEK